MPYSQKVLFISIEDDLAEIKEGNMAYVPRCKVNIEVFRYMEDYGEEQNPCREEYQKMCDQFADQIDSNREEARMAVKSRLEEFVHKYSQDEQFFFDLDPIEHEMESVFVRRDSIQILVNFIGHEFPLVDLSEVNESIRKIDAVLRESASEHMEWAAMFEHGYFPEEFWWRHPEEW